MLLLSNRIASFWYLTPIVEALAHPYLIKFAVNFSVLPFLMVWATGAKTSGISTGLMRGANTEFGRNQTTSVSGRNQNTYFGSTLPNLGLW